MNEQHRQLITRLFGPGAVLGGDWGGELRILVDGIICGRGRTLADAIAAATAALSVVARWTASA